MNMHELQRQIPSRNASSVMNASTCSSFLLPARCQLPASCLVPLSTGTGRGTGAAAVTVTDATPTAYVSYKMLFRRSCALLICLCA